jgi:hypothetical protein
MHGMIAAQVAFCFLVIFISGLFVRTFESLANKPLGFAPDNLLLLDVATQQGQPAVVWDQIADSLRSVPGVERVAIAGWPLLSGGNWNNFVSVGGAAPGPIVTSLLAISPGWAETMKIPLLDGRDFRAGDTAPGQAIVNLAFVRTFFDGKNPIGKTFQERENHYRVVGLVADAPYGNLRDAIVPVAYIPFHEVNVQRVAQPETQETFLVRTSGSNPLALASVLRKAIPQARAGFGPTGRPSPSTTSICAKPEVQASRAHGKVRAKYLSRPTKFRSSRIRVTAFRSPIQWRASIKT